MENETEEKMKETTKKPATKKPETKKTTTTKKATTTAKKPTGAKTTAKKTGAKKATGTTTKKTTTTAKKSTTTKATAAKKTTGTAKKVTEAKTVKSANEEAKEVVKKVEVKEPEAKKEKIEPKKKETKVIKEKKKRIWPSVIGCILIVVLAIYLGLVIRNFFILNTYSAAMEAYTKSNNYFVKRMDDSTESPMVNTTTYYKDGIIKNYVDVDNKQRSMIAYQNPNTDERIIRIESDGHKVAIVSKAEGGLVPSGQIYNIFGAMNRKDNFFLSLMTKTTTEECNGKECYKINMQGMKVWIDKETCLVVRLIDGKYQDAKGIEHEMATNYEYEFGTVTDEQVAKPDLTGCEIQVQE